MKQLLKSFIRYMGYEIQAIPSPNRFAVFDETQARDHELLMSFATRAAGVSRSQDQTSALRNLHLSGLLREQPRVEATRVEIGDYKTLEIGVWRRQKAGRDEAFIRPEDGRGEAFHWSTNARLEPKRCKWRIVLLGESVARGYLYHPHFNPAAALQAMLQSQLGTGVFDVIDLAKSGQTMQELKTIIGQSLALLPDVLVIFAGNNWRQRIADIDIPYVESLLRQDGVAGMKAFLDERSEQAVRDMTVNVSSLLAPRGVKVVWIVPEFNLDDWVDPPSNVPHLPGENTGRWRDLDRRARQALQTGDRASARDAARKMNGLDGGTSSVPLRILAEDCRSNGDWEGTRRYLELARDAEGWDPSFAYSPRTSSGIQNALRAAASLPGTSVVDLPEIIHRHLDVGLPDRRVFMDYCHLTAEGINVAVRAITAQVVPLLTGRSVSTDALRAIVSFPSDKVEGKACFLAAVHNAHFYQGREILDHWLSRALQLWPESAHLMQRYIDYQTRDLPLALCKSGLELLDLDEMEVTRYLSRGGARRVDLSSIELIVTSLAGVGIEVGDELAALRLARHSIGHSPKDLTDFYLSSSIPGRWERGWTTASFPTDRGWTRLYTSAFWETSNFIFIARKGQSASVRFAYRVPMQASPGGMVAVDINGHRLAELKAEQSWCAVGLAVPGDQVLEGLNEIEIRWPSDEPSSKVVLDRAADELLARRLPYFFRVFGEIQTLSVRTENGH